jgi:hypothetical protein
VCVNESHADTVVVVAVGHAVRYMECLCGKYIINTAEAAVSCLLSEK